MSLAGLKVLSLESRRAAEIATLIRNHGGEPVVAPSMREVPIEHNTAAFEFAERLFSGAFDMMILLTGSGTRFLQTVLASRYGAERFPAALRTLTTVCRGPKPAAALREMNVSPTLIAGEPNTWREVLAVTEGRPERHIAVQEYGKSNPELLDGLRARGAEVSPVRVYQWQLPEDTGPLRDAARRLAAGEIDVALFTTSAQIDHLLRVSGDMEDEVRAGLRRAVVASIGPTTTEALQEHGIQPDIEPEHPKMGFLLQAAAARAAEIRKSKR